jgi:diguanylate cyclase (GGDEF)-like protein
MGKDATSEEWLDFIIDTLKQLDEGIQGAFLQEFLLRLVSLEVSEKESITHWEGVLAHQRQLTDKLGRPVTLRTAAVDYFGELRILRNPIIMEYGELKKLRHNAATDPLTGLNNRRIFEEYLHREINRASRYGSPFALLAFDLRKFKSVNDTYGHRAGDEILRSVARAILETIRGSDVSCRTGGDEFAILLPQAERLSAEILADRIARKFEEYANYIAPNTSVAIDYGIAIFPEDGNDAPTLIASADKTLYTTKQWVHSRSATHLGQSEEKTAQAGESPPEAKAEEDSSDEPPSQGASQSARPAEQEAKTLGADRTPNGRKDERIGLEGTHALGVVRVGGKSSTVRVIDLSRGGVCLMVDQMDLPETFPARLHVPLAPGGELTLRRVYCLPLPEGRRRVGCSFALIPKQLSV